MQTAEDRRSLRVGVVGVGLIGGSIALGLRGRPHIDEVVAIDREERVLWTALELGAADRVSTHLDAARDCDVVFVAVPVPAIVPVVRELAAHCRPGTIISDVGSTKSAICREVREFLPPHLTFVGGHPMAGSERAGIDAADPYLFENAVYVLTPGGAGDPLGLQRMRWLVGLLGAHPLVMTPEEHDRAVAVTSHLPHAVAAALVLALVREGAALPAAFQLAAGGFRDTTRIASGNPSLWRDICLSNRTALLRVLATFEEELARFRRTLEELDGNGVEAFLAEAKTARDRMPAHAKGLIGQVFDIVVHVVDRPGTISRVSGLLAERGLNIIDIEILRVREGEGGTLRLAFETREAMEQALAILRAAGYRARSRQGGS